MVYHKFRLKKTLSKTLARNFKVLVCKIFGHRLNEDPANHWCERCGLAYEEAYYPKKYWEEIKK